MRSKNSSQKGASLVEFALVLPLLLFLLFGIIEFGVMAYDKAVITNASREGARRAIIYRTDPNNNFAYDPLDITEVRTEVNNYLAGRLISLQVPPPLAQVNATWLNSPLGDPMVEVQVNWTYNFLILPNLSVLPFIGTTGLTGSVPLNAITRMRME